MDERNRFEKLRDLCLFLTEEKAIAVLNHVGAKHRVAYRDDMMLGFNNQDKDFERFNLIIKDNIVVEIFFE